ncbi:MAG: LPS export ABC transporter periplasmic protein LptC [Burkholderiales bacterium]|nr:LPS export ABC transporter periplasmic protein LptC [Burkholderiales bacterium]
MAVELHLPDLPEVAISLGHSPAGEPIDAAAGAASQAGVSRRITLPWHLRVRDALSAYLPLLLMLLIALATWWLVKETPVPEPPAPPRAMRSEPDYSMRSFALERFDADGRLKMRIEGDLLRHYPDTNRVEIDGARIRAFAADGRETLATARRALGNGDGSEIQLLGGAEVTSRDAAGQPVLIRSEFLHAFLVTERVRTHLPVLARFGGTEMTAGGIDYDNAARRLEFRGPVRAVFIPRAAPERR